MRRLILDTDIGGDVDDALALALCVRHPGIDLRAVTTVSGDTALRARIAARLLQLAGRDDIEVATGEPSAGQPSGRPFDLYHGGLLDGVDVGAASVSKRTALEVLLEADQSVTVATIGMQTNVAGALAQDADFTVEQLTVMGGFFQPMMVYSRPVPPDSDYNLNTDAAASVRSLNAGLPTLYIPCDVTFGTFMTTAQLDRLRHSGDPLCEAVAGMIDIWTPALRKMTGRRMPDDHVTMLHDPLAVACTVDGSFVTVERMPVTAALVGDHVRTFVDPIEGHDAEVVTAVDNAAFSEWLVETLLTA